MCTETDFPLFLCVTDTQVGPEEKDQGVDTVMCQQHLDDPKTSKSGKVHFARPI